MDDTLPRPRYQRHIATRKKRKRHARIPGAFATVLVRQVLISVLVLAITAIVGSIDTPAANYVADKIKIALSQNIEFSNIFNQIDAFVRNLTGNKTVKKDAAKDKIPDSGGNESKIAIDTSEKIVFSMPVDGVIKAGFGETGGLASNINEVHRGIDIEVNRDSAVQSVYDGEVSETGFNRTYCKYVKISHVNGLETVYAHCSLLLTEKGRKVKQGDVIAKVGSSEASIGSHLHFEVWKDGTSVNPLDYLTGLT